MNDFGNYLRKLRGKRTLREMEQLTGLSHSYLHTLEKGIDPRSKKERKPTPEVLQKLASTLSIDYYELLEKAGYVNKNDFFIQETSEGVKLHTGNELANRDAPYPTLSENSLHAREISQETESYLDDLSIFLNKDVITYYGHRLTKEERDKISEMLERMFPQYVKD